MQILCHTSFLNSKILLSLSGCLGSKKIDLIICFQVKTASNVLVDDAFAKNLSDMNPEIHILLSCASNVGVIN